MAITLRALAFASRWFDAATVHGVFEPLIADWQREWQEASGVARYGVWLRGAGSLLVSLVATSPRIVLTPWPAGTLRRSIVRVALWTTVVSALMTLPFLNDLAPRLGAGVAAYLLLLLLSSTIALSFPFAITTVVDVIRTAPQPQREERIAAVKFAIGAAALMVVLVGWGFPAANQQYRVASMRAVSGGSRWPAPVRGMHEMSLVELVSADELNSALWVGRESWVSSRVEAIRGEIALRAALTMLPILLIWMRWRALRLPRGRWYSALPLAASAPITWVLFYGMLEKSRPLADVFFAPAWSGPLVAIAVVATGSIVVEQLRQRARAT